MAEPLTIWECPKGHLFSADLNAGTSVYPACACGGQAKEVRVFREEDVRPLYQALWTIDGETDSAETTAVAYLAHTDFPAPEEWR